MGDIICKIYGEPWDTYGVKQSLRDYGDGDMTMRQAKRFLAGKGCPCCPEEKLKSQEPPEFEEKFYASLLANME